MYNLLCTFDTWVHLIIRYKTFTCASATFDTFYSSVHFSQTCNVNTSGDR